MKKTGHYLVILGASLIGLSLGSVLLANLLQAVFLCESGYAGETFCKINLPYIASSIDTLAMFGLVSSFVVGAPSFILIFVGVILKNFGKDKIVSNNIPEEKNNLN